MGAAGSDELGAWCTKAAYDESDEHGIATHQGDPGGASNVSEYCEVAQGYNYFSVYNSSEVFGEGDNRLWCMDDVMALRCIKMTPVELEWVERVWCTRGEIARGEPNTVSMLNT